MHTADYIPGLPRRWGVALAKRAGFRHFDVIHDREEHKPVPLDASDDAIERAGDSAARECYRYAQRYQLASLIVDAIYLLCLQMGVRRPVGATEGEIIAKAADKNWWIRAIRRAHTRRFEHIAIRLGFVSYKTGIYVSHETVTRQIRWNRRNEKLLAAIKKENEFGQVYSLAELAALGPANKAIRRGELMTRIRGFEEVATDLKHVGLFWTITAPSKYHAVLSVSGQINPKYLEAGEPSPRDAQAYLVDVWKRIRAALHRRGIKPYGFRIAEPHHDGCPHWHMLLFVAPEQEAEMTKIIRKYALEEDFGEWAKEDNRAKLVRIESSKGTAAGYIAKYVCKNVDGVGVGEHQVREDGTAYVVVPDMVGGEEIVPSQRVTLWAQTWGIRQFQQIGGAPIGVWRELRRIKEETVQVAPAALKQAWQAAQRQGDELASWADYLRAQGGPCVGRDGAIQLAKRQAEIEGKYATYTEDKPCGVYHAANAHAVYESVRFTWTVLREKREAVVAVPWTGVNNCTQVDHAALSEKMEKATQRLAEAVKNKKFSAPAWVDWPEIKRKAREIEKETVRFSMKGGRHA